MKIVTTPTIERCEINQYLGIIGAEVIFGANMFRDFAAQIRDSIGGRSGSYETVFADAREEAIAILEARAKACGADAVIGVRFDYHTINTMMMVAATGTAVSLRKSAKEAEQEKIRTREEIPEYHIQIGGRERGPFSLAQLRDLKARNCVDGSENVRSEDNKTVSLDSLLAQ